MRRRMSTRLVRNRTGAEIACGFTRWAKVGVHIHLSARRAAMPGPKSNQRPSRGTSGFQHCQPTAVCSGILTSAVFWIYPLSVVRESPGAAFRLPFPARRRLNRRRFSAVSASARCARYRYGAQKMCLRSDQCGPARGIQYCRRRARDGGSGRTRCGRSRSPAFGASAEAAFHPRSYAGSVSDQPPGAAVTWAIIKTS